MRRNSVLVTHGSSRVNDDDDDDDDDDDNFIYAS